MQEPVGVRQVLRSPAAAHLHDRYFVALLNQAVRTHAAAKAGADDDEVKIELAVGTQSGLLFNSGVVCVLEVASERPEVAARPVTRGAACQPEC
jgi:hypothetical protein